MIIHKIFTAAFFSLIIGSAIYGFKVFLITDKKRLKLVREATEKNHILKGKLIKNKIVRRLDPARREDSTFEISCDLGIYEYQYKNKTYKTKIYAPLGHLTKEIDLFYVKNPKKATTEYLLGITEISWLKYFIITFIIIYMIVL